MKNVIEYFYRMEVEQIKCINDKYYFIFDNTNYLFEEYKNKPSIDVLLETQKYYEFHKIVPSVDGRIFINYENKNYILFKINLKNNRKIILDDVIYVSKLNLKSNTMPKNWGNLWSKKVDAFENYIINKDKIFEFRGYYDYFVGMGENAILYYKYVKMDRIRCGFTYNRIDFNYTLYDLYNPLNVIISPIVRGIAEYLKSCFFYGDKIDVDLLLDLDINYYEKMLFISRMLFPTQFFDLYKTGKEEDRDKIQCIISFSTSYEKYLTSIFKTIKKRHEFMPSIGWLSFNRL